MRLPMRHLLASSAVAGLLFLLPMEHANAQDNRNSWGWGAAGGGGIVLSFIAAAAGAAGGSSIVAWQLSKLASKGKRSESAVNMGDHGKLPPRCINKDPLAWADQELVEIERKVCEMEKKIKSIPSDELMSTEDVIRHLSDVDTKDDAEKIIYITGISDLKIQSYILANVSIAKCWLQNTREVLNIHKLGKANQKQVKIYDTDNVNRNPNMPYQHSGLDPQNPYETSEG